MEPHTIATASSLVKAGQRAARRGEYQDALGLLDRAVERSPDPEALRLRGLVRLRLGQPALAVADLQRATQSLGACAACHHELGTASLRAGDLQGALRAVNRVLELDRGLAGAHAIRAAALLQLRRAEEALEAITAAVCIEPTDAGMLHNRAVVLATLGRYGEAVGDYHRALEHEPDSGGTLNNLAWLLATAPDSALRDGPRAVVMARRAVAVGRTGAWLDTLAAAHAESGDFEAAVRAETEAYERSRPPNLSFKKRVEIYRQGRTFAAWRA